MQNRHNKDLGNTEKMSFCFLLFFRSLLNVFTVLRVKCTFLKEYSNKTCVLSIKL